MTERIVVKAEYRKNSSIISRYATSRRRTTMALDYILGGIYSNTESSLIAPVKLKNRNVLLLADSDLNSAVREIINAKKELGKEKPLPFTNATITFKIRYSEKEFIDVVYVTVNNYDIFYVDSNENQVRDTKALIRFLMNQSLGVYVEDIKGMLKDDDYDEVTKNFIGEFNLIY